MQEAEAQFKTAMKALPERQEIPSLLTSISRSGQDVGLNFSLFAPKPDVPREFYAEIPVEIKATGGYHDLAVFFDKVARLPRIVNIKSLGMEMNKKKGVNLDPLDLQMSCKAVTYKFVEPPRKQPGMKKKK
jgi:type IV pilus assembly protein PilO